MVAFNVFSAAPQGVFPPVPHARADRYNLMLTQNDGPRQIPFNHVNDRDETVVMLSGSYTTRVGTQRIAVNEGDVLVIRAGIPHGDIETGSTGYRVLQIEGNAPTAPDASALPPQGA
jgi:mannose-6-phosphate isomerase-like protein (cupin superfamily)